MWYFGVDFNDGMLRNMKLTVKEATQLLVMSNIESAAAGDIVIGDEYCGVDDCEMV